MKTIIIQTVSNGWIVREYFPCPDVYHEPLAVFNRMIDLQAALPRLLEAKEEYSDGIPRWPAPSTGAKLQDMLDRVRDSAGSGDRRSETIGGSELTPSA